MRWRSCRCAAELVRVDTTRLQCGRVWDLDFAKVRFIVFDCDLGICSCVRGISGNVAVFDRVVFGVRERDEIVWKRLVAEG